MTKRIFYVYNHINRNRKIMNMDKVSTVENDRGFMVHNLLDMGEEMLLCGAEIHRVEDTLTRMGKAYGATNMNVFVITSVIMITAVFDDHFELTSTRRINRNGGNDFYRLEQLNALSRRYCNEPYACDVLHQDIKDIASVEADQKPLLIGGMIIVASFCMFFGGCWYDALLGTVFGYLIVWMMLNIQDLFPKTIIFNLMASFVSGTFTCLLAKALPFIHADKIMIGEVMILIPGIAITNAIRDILVGDTISGVLRLIESVLFASAMACGYLLAIMFVEGIL